MFVSWKMNIREVSEALRNTVILRSQGEYLYFADSDDLFDIKGIIDTLLSISDIKKNLILYLLKMMFQKASLMIRRHFLLIRK